MIIGWAFYFVLIGVPLWFLGERLGVLIARALFPSLPAKFSPRDHFFVAVLGSITSVILVGGLYAVLFHYLLQIDVPLPLPEWAPFYGRVRHDILNMTSLFVISTVATIITAWIFTKRRRKKG